MREQANLSSTRIVRAELWTAQLLEHGFEHFIFKMPKRVVHKVFVGLAISWHSMDKSGKNKIPYIYIKKKGMWEHNSGTRPVCGQQPIAFLVFSPVIENQKLSVGAERNLKMLRFPLRGSGEYLMHFPQHYPDSVAISSRWRSHHSQIWSQKTKSHLQDFLLSRNKIFWNGSNLCFVHVLLLRLLMENHWTGK